MFTGVCAADHSVTLPNCISCYSPTLQPVIVVVVMAAFTPFRSNRMGFLHLLLLALVVSLAVLGKIEAQVAVVALH